MDGIGSIMEEQIDKALAKDTKIEVCHSPPLHVSFCEEAKLEARKSF
jgi:hypothetical protein